MDSRGDRGHPEPGATLGNYRIERLLGRGGMGAVFLAYDSSLHRQVAVKLVAEDGRDEGSRAQLLREARSAAALNRPAICTIHEVGDANGATFIAMEYVEGRSLHDRLADGPLPIELALDYAIQAADALAYAHDRGVVHRDFKAGNVIVTPAGRIKIIDFGLARRLETASATATIDGLDQRVGIPQQAHPTRWHPSRCGRRLPMRAPISGRSAWLEAVRRNLSFRN